MNLGTAIRRIRAALNLTLAEFGEFVGLPAPTISGVERSERPLPEPAMKKLLNTLQVTEEELGLIGVRNAELIIQQKHDGGKVYSAVKQQCVARNALHLKLE